MTATQTQLRRGTAAQCDAMTPAVGEVVIDTTNKRGRLGDGATGGGIIIPNREDIVKNSFQWCSVGGTADAITLTSGAAIAAYAAGHGFLFVATDDNTTSVTFAVDGLTTKTGKKNTAAGLANLEEGDIVTGNLYRITYDGTYFVVENVSAAQAAAGWELLAVASGGGTSYDFTGTMTSDYDAYAFVLNGVRPSTSSTTLRMRIRRSGQSSYEAGSSAYNSHRQTFGTSGTYASVDSSGFDLATAVEGAANDGGGVGGTVYLLNTNSTSREKLCSWTLAVGTAGTPGVWIGGGRYSGTGFKTDAFDGARFIFSSGNVQEGKILAFGIKSSL